MNQFPKQILSAALLFFVPVSLAQSTGINQPDSPSANHKSLKTPSTRERRKAAELFMTGAHALEQNDPRTAEKDFLRATELAPENKEYLGALAVARSHVVTLLVQEAEKARLAGDLITARSKLSQALSRDPQNAIVTQHIYDLTENKDTQSTASGAEATIAGAPVALLPNPGKQSIHLRSMSRDLLRRVFSIYGIEATIDDSVRSRMVRMDVDDVDFDHATNILSLLTDTFLTPLDPKRVLVAADTRENRQKFERQVMETIYLPGLTTTEMSDMGNVARQVFEAQHVSVAPQQGTLSVRVADQTLQAFNSTLADLVEGHSQVVLDVRIIEVAKTKTRNVGVQLPQQSTAFNLLSEANSIISQNQSLVDQIISSGLAKAGDWQAIAAILIASGAISNSILSQPFAVFGGGISATGLTLGSTGVNMTLNSSDTRTLDEVRLRVGDQEAGTIRAGSRYPITTSSFSNMLTSNLGIPGLSNAGLSSNLLASLGVNLTGINTTATIPQIQFEDLGLTLKATPHILKTDDISLAISMKIEALGGGSLNNIPILNNRSFEGTITVPNEKSALIVSNLTRQESKAVGGIPGLGELPGFAAATTDKSTEQDVSKLVILITPHIVRHRADRLKSPLVTLPRSR